MDASKNKAKESELSGDQYWARIKKKADNNMQQKQRATSAP
jgi:hypothetical protein